MRKLFATKSHNSEVTMCVQCKIISLISRLQHIITFFIVRCRQIKMLNKTARFGVSNLQTKL